MRIAFIVPGGFDRSGRERVIPVLLWLIERLARRNEVHVFALRHYREPCTYPLAGATIHDLGRVEGRRGSRLVQHYLRLLGALRSSGPFDVLHGYWATPAGVLAAIAGRHLRIPSVVTFDSGEFASIPEIDYGLQRHWPGRLAVALTARLATRLTVGTDYMHSLARAKGATTDRVPLGVDAGRLGPIADRRDGPPWRLLHVASLNHVKDQTTLLGAVSRLVHRVPDLHLDIVGEDTLGGRIQALCTTLGLERHVTFHGFQPTDHLGAFYGRAHLFVLSSWHEAAGAAVLEASAAGLSTVGTAVGYVADWSPERALAVPIRDPDALADGIFRLLEDPARRIRMADAARAWVLAHDADWTARQLERIYKELVDRNPEPQNSDGRA